MQAKGIITAIVRYYDMTLCNLQNELHAMTEKYEKARGNEAELHRLREQLDEYSKLESLHTAAVTGFKSDTNLLQNALDMAREEARSAQQEVVYLRDSLNDVFRAMTCVTVDAVAHCTEQDKAALRTFIELVKEHAPLNIQGRVQINSMLANLNDDF